MDRESKWEAAATGNPDDSGSRGPDGSVPTFVRCDCDYKEFNTFLRQSPMQFHEVAYEHARSIVLGAAEYARALGFEPHEDWAISKSVIESERSFDRRFKFGKDGEPFYIQGPDDDAKKIMSRLAPLAKQGKAHYLTLAKVFDDGFDDDPALDERYDQIEKNCRRRRQAVVDHRLRSARLRCICG